MRSPLRKELIACFKREFEPRFPQFALADTERQAWTWAWKMAPNLIFFVLLQAFEREDQFVVEVAWSEDGEFPFGAIGETKVERSQGRERLGRLWEKGPDTPIWDLAPAKTRSVQERMDALSRKESPERLPDPLIEQTLPLVCPLVRDALDKFEKYGIPLFHRVAEARGLEWPSGLESKSSSKT